MSTNETKRKAVGEVDDEQSIIEYLKTHPDFFKRNLQVLADMDVPSSSSEQVVSLAERQVSALRDDNRALAARFEEIVDRAKENEALEDRVHSVAIRLVAATSFEEVFGLAPTLIRKQFGIPYVTIRLGAKPAYASTWGEEEDDELEHSLQTILERVAHRRSVCDDRLPRATLGFLFGENSASVDSCALVPIVDRDEHVLGILGLGAGDHQRFQPNMGTIFLDRIGALLGATFDRLYRGAANAR